MSDKVLHRTEGSTPKAHGHRPLAHRTGVAFAAHHVTQRRRTARSTAAPNWGLFCAGASRAPLTTRKGKTLTATQEKTTAFRTAMRPSVALSAIVGSQPMARVEATKRVWEYIKGRNLQSPTNRCSILCDDALKAVAGKAEVTAFEMTGLVNRNLASV
jgi:DNA topoisomerase-3